MGKKNRKVPGINASSTADISFILLIFFLITTSMDTDTGLGRTLPKPPEDEQKENEIKVKERNILNIRISKNNELMIGTGNDDNYATVEDVKERAKEFIANKQNKPNLPELKPKKIDLMGVEMVTENHVISVQADRGTSYWIYFKVQDALVSAYNELRDELAYEKFGIKKYEFCSDAQQEAIREYYPQKISEAEPKKYGEAK